MRTTTSPAAPSTPAFNYLYDDEGNITRRQNAATLASTYYEYDHRNRLVSVTDQVHIDYQYDAYNRLVSRSNVSSFVFWSYDTGINPVLEFENSTLAHRYLWSNSVDELLADEQVTTTSSGGNTLWGLADHLGTIRDIADANEATGVTSVVNHRRYNAFGKLMFQSGAANISFGYTGKYSDAATGLQNNLNRWYDPNLGKWISQDPIGFAAGDANLYRYVGNGTTNATDPIGLVIIWVDGIKTDKGSTHAASVAKGLGAYAADNKLTEQAFLYFDFPAASSYDGMSSPSAYDKKVAASLKQLIDTIQNANSCGEPIYLVGFSNGTDIVKLALDAGVKVDGVVFLGSAVDRDTDLQKAMKSTPWLHNHRSEYDFTAGSFADGMGSRQMRESKKIKNKSLRGVTDELVDGFVHTETGGDKSGHDEMKTKNKKTRVPWTSYFAGFSLLGKLLKPTQSTCISDGAEFTAPDGTKVMPKPGYQTVPSGVKR